MNIDKAIKVLKKAKYIGSDKYATDYGKRLNEAIDTVVKEFEKPLPTDKELKERGNLICRIMLRQLNCGFTKDKVTFSMKELLHWFETGQHLKEWKEWDTL